MTERSQTVPRDGAWPCVPDEPLRLMLRRRQAISADLAFRHGRLGRPGRRLKGFRPRRVLPILAGPRAARKWRFSRKPT